MATRSSCCDSARAWRTTRCTSGAAIRRPGGAALPAGAQPAIGAGEHAQLLAAFNGGFLMGAGCLPCGVGGMKVAGRVLVPLVSGMTSLVLAPDGAASMGVWDTASRRPGRPSTACASACPGWCPRQGEPECERRQCLGSDARRRRPHGPQRGMHRCPRQHPLRGQHERPPVGPRQRARLGRRGDRDGARHQPEWVQAHTARSPGGRLGAAVPNQHRPADQYLRVHGCRSCGVQTPRMAGAVGTLSRHGIRCSPGGTTCWPRSGATWRAGR
jgi:hypothetical protein